MCTVTFLPRPDGFHFGSTRDEAPSRNAKNWAVKNGWHYPVDDAQKGTWLLIRKNAVRSLMNGGFEKHKHQPPYKMSRGWVVLDSAEFERLEDFFKDLDLKGIEPFTFIEAEMSRLTEWVWDGEKLHQVEKDATLPYVRSSSPLYTKEQKSIRQRWFQQFIEESNRPDLMQFHLSEYSDDTATNVLMKRPHVQSISITIYHSNEGKAEHLDLLSSSSRILEI